MGSETSALCRATVAARHLALIDRMKWWAIRVALMELRRSCGHATAPFRVLVDFAMAITAELSPSMNPGDVVGSSGGPDTTRAFLWTRNRGMEDLGVLPGNAESSATGINNPGQVVGYSSGPFGTRAFLWTRNGGMEDLGTLPGGSFSRAFAINDPATSWEHQEAP